MTQNDIKCHFESFLGGENFWGGGQFDFRALYLKSNSSCFLSSVISHFLKHISTQHGTPEGMLCSYICRKILLPKKWFTHNILLQLNIPDHILSYHMIYKTGGLKLNHHVEFDQSLKVKINWMIYHKSLFDYRTKGRKDIYTGFFHYKQICLTKPIQYKL